MTPDIYQAVIDQAHKRGLRVIAHLFYLSDARGLLNAREGSAANRPPRQGL
jgi:uncharacterized lipoprotein YddW (UPF0748 family)